MRSGARGALAAKLAGAVVVLALGITGLAGAYSYWQSYYVHRGFKAITLVHGASAGRRLRVNFYSPALRRENDYLVYLPPGYDPARRYPVDYLLHGSPGQANEFLAIVSLGVRMDNLIAEHRVRPMLLVFPDGTIGGDILSDSEWANTSAGAYANSVLDVVRDVDHRFATIRNRAHRVIGGVSAGGYGATNIVLHHLGVFGGLESWSGYYLETRTGVFAGSSRAELRRNSPLDYARGLAAAIHRKPFRAFLLVGRYDQVSPQTAPMAKLLAQDGASVTYGLYKGGHDWELWAAHANQMLELASRWMSAPRLRVHGLRTLTPGAKASPRAPCRNRPGHPRCRRHHRRFPFTLPGFRLGLPPLRARPAGVTPPLVLTSAARPYLSAGLAPVAKPRPARRHPGFGRLLAGLLLALGSAALINLGFLLQHRGLSETGADGLGAALRRACRNPRWLGGQLIGWVGFGAQIVAVALAPLSLVQSFAAGGLALSVPLAAWLFRHRISGTQVGAVLVIAVALAVLPIGFSTRSDRLHVTALAIAVGAGAVLGVALALGRRPFRRAIAAGVFYGLADAAIKAVSVRFSAHGAGALLSPWTAVAAVTTFGGFLAFQAALRSGGAISAISLMNALTAIAALACGALAFAESLGTNAVAVVAHGVAIALVLACVPLLAEAQAEMADVTQGGERGGRAARLEPSYDAPG